MEDVMEDIVEDIVEDGATEDSKIPLKTVPFKHKIDVSLPMVSLSERLASLLSKYCPHEKEMNSQLIQKSVGQETLVIKAIEALIEETPFDELQLSIFCYAKSVVRSMGEEPYDQNLMNRERRGPPVTVGRSSLKRVTTMSSSAFSLNSRAVSHMTGKSGFTSKTNGTAETFRMTNTTKVTNMGLDRSFEESAFEDSSTTDEDDGKKLIFDMRLLQEDNFNGKEKLQNKGREKQKSKHAPLITTPMTKNHIKRGKPMTRPMGIKEIDVCGIYESEEIKSAYGADNDNDADGNSLHDGEDTISALSDSFGPSHSKRYRKEKRLLEKKTEEKNVLPKVKQPLVDLTNQTKSNGTKKRRGRNPASHYTVTDTDKIRKDAQHMPIEQSPQSSAYADVESPIIRPSRSRQARSKLMEKDSLLPRYTGTHTDDDSSSWDDDTVTTNPSLCISSDEKGGMYRYCRGNTRII